MTAPKDTREVPRGVAQTSVTDAMISAAIEAAWPGPEIVYSDEFDSAEAMMKAALEAALAVSSTDRGGSDD